MPERTCIGCRKAYDKKMLVKLVIGANGSFVIDNGGNIGGRSGYLCPNKNCLNAAYRKGRSYFVKVFRRDLKLPEIEELWKGIRGLSLFTDETK
ncbi:MAG: YlxR family protein [Thermodesulfobacteriota bacterium]